MAAVRSTSLVAVSMFIMVDVEVFFIPVRSKKTTCVKAL